MREGGDVAENVMRQVNDFLRTVLEDADLVGPGNVKFDAPTRDWVSQHCAPHPVASVYLYDMREDTRQCAVGAITLYRAPDTGGLTTRNLGPQNKAGELAPARYLALSYMVTVWSESPEDVHPILARCYERFAPMARLDVDLGEYLGFLGASVTLAVTPPTTDGRAFTELWLALGNGPMPAVHFTVTLPLDPPEPSSIEGPRIDAIGVDVGPGLPISRSGPDRP